jgi:hypothetical protein
VSRDHGRGAIALRASPLLEFEVLGAPDEGVRGDRAWSHVGPVNVPTDLLLTVESGAA